MASMEKELEELLLEAGNRLLSPPSSVDELLPLLDQVESCLSKVEQSPTNSMRTALCPSMKALVADELLRHSDMDVKVTVASCISEITRITAPDAPYDDELMKEIFQLIVVAFEKLFDTSNRSYSKRVSILETVAKVRSCVVMLDLECDALILEMFQHFLKAIRDDHPDNVFSSMETIMTLVLEESEDISLELLSPLLNSVKKDNQDVLPIAQKLGEKVIENCTAKLKPYMMQAVQSLGISFNDYSTVVASICQETSNTVDHNDSNISGKHLADESKSLEKSGLDDQSQVAKELLPEEAGPGSVDPTVDKSPQSVMSNGTAQTGNSDSLVDPNSLKKKLERSRRANRSKSTDASTKTEPDNLDSERFIKSETKPDPATRKTRGRKPNPLLNSSQVSDRSRIDCEKENVELPDRRKSRGKDADSATSEGLSTKEAAVLSENEKEAQTQLSSPTTSPVEAVNVASPSPNQVLPDGNRSRKGRRMPKKKGSINDEADPGSPSVPRGALLGDHVDDQTPPSPDVILKKESEHTSDDETKPHKRLGKKALAGNPNEKTPTPVDIVMKKESGSTSDSGVKPLKKSGMKVDPIDANEDESSAKQHEGTRKRGWGKTVSDKDVVGESGKKKMASSSKSATKSSNKDQSQLVETPKTKSKRKLTPGKEEASEVPHGVKDFGENLVGSKIKVWWPDDEMFYEGHIESFDPVEKKHKVLYVDGDEETLTLNTERWEFVRDGNVADGELATDIPSPDASSEMHVKKKAKTNSDSLNKHAKPNVSLKRAGGAAKSETGKSKSGATKSGGKSKDDGKLNSKSKDDTPKIANKSKDDSGSKTKDDTPKTGNKSKGVHTTPSKSKDDSPKISTKSKDDSIKSGTKSKGETPKTTSKSSANGTTAKGKSSKSKVQESEDSAKGRSDPAKAQESKTKSGKKRGRRVSS